MTRLVRRQILLLACTLACSSALLTSSAHAKINSIKAVDVEETSEQTIVKIKAASRPTFTVFKLSQPTRLFIDIVGADVGALEPNMAVGNGVIERLTVQQFTSDMGPVGRVIVNFEQDATYDIKTKKSTIELRIDGTARTRPDLKLKAVQREAKRLEQAVARERSLLKDLKAARRQEEKLREEAESARLDEDRLIQRVEDARNGARKSSLLVQQAADRHTTQLADMARRGLLSPRQQDLLTDADGAKSVRRQAVTKEATLSKELATTAKQALNHQRAKLSAAKAAQVREQKEREAIEAEAVARDERRLVAERLADAKSRGRASEAERYRRELDKRDRTLKTALRRLKASRNALQEARLAEAQAAARLRQIQEDRVRIEGDRRAAEVEALRQELLRIQALKGATPTGMKAVDSGIIKASQKAYEEVAELERTLKAQRQRVQKTRERAEVEQARIALLDGQLQNERQALAALKAARAAEEARLAKVREELKRLQAQNKAASRKAISASSAYEKQLAALDGIQKTRKAEEARLQSARQKAEMAARVATEAKAAAVRIKDEAQRSAQGLTREARARARAAERRAEEAAQRSALLEQRAQQHEKRVATAETRLAEAERLTAAKAKKAQVAAKQATAAERKAAAYQRAAEEARVQALKAAETAKLALQRAARAEEAAQAKERAADAVAKRAAELEREALKREEQARGKLDAIARAGEDLAKARAKALAAEQESAARAAEASAKAKAAEAEAAKVSSAAEAAQRRSEAVAKTAAAAAARAEAAAQARIARAEKRARSKAKAAEREAARAEREAAEAAKLAADAEAEAERRADAAEATAAAAMQRAIEVERLAAARQKAAKARQVKFEAAAQQAQARAREINEANRANEAKAVKTLDRLKRADQKIQDAERRAARAEQEARVAAARVDAVNHRLKEKKQAEKNALERIRTAEDRAAKAERNLTQLEKEMAQRTEKAQTVVAQLKSAEAELKAARMRALDANRVASSQERAAAAARQRAATAAKRAERVHQEAAKSESLAKTRQSKALQSLSSAKQAEKAATAAAARARVAQEQAAAREQAARDAVDRARRAEKLAADRALQARTAERRAKAAGRSGSVKERESAQAAARAARVALLAAEREREAQKEVARQAESRRVQALAHATALATERDQQKRTATVKAEKADKQRRAADAAQRTANKAQALHQSVSDEHKRQLIAARRAELERKLAEQRRKRAQKKSSTLQASAKGLKAEAERRKALTEQLKARIRAHQNRAKRADQAAAMASQVQRKERAAAERRPVVTGVSFDRTRDGGQVSISLSRATNYEIVRRSRGQMELRLKGTVIPKELQRTLDTSDLGSPVQHVSSFAATDTPGIVRVVVQLASAASDSVMEQNNRLIWSFRGQSSARATTTPQPRVAPVPGSGPSAYVPSQRGAQRAPQANGGRMPPGVHAYPGMVAAEGGPVAAKSGGFVSKPFMSGRRTKRKKKYSGKNINLTIKDADIQHVLTFLAKEGGVNIVASEDVKGLVTFHLENIPWDLALDMVLKTQGYDYVREHGVFRVAPAEDIQKEFEAEIKRKQTIDELKPLVVRFVTVNYAEMETIAEHIKTVLSKNGTVSADTSTSTLIIKDVEEHVEAAEDIVRRLDVQLPQVLIEARIVEASTNFSRSVGVQWGGEFNMSPAFGNPTGLTFPSVIGVRGGADDTTAAQGGIMDSTPNFAVNLPAATGAGAGGALGLTLGSIGGAANINLRLSAAEDEGQVKIVSAPKILTVDGKKATINQGVSIPISVVSANGVNTQFFQADLKLEVVTNTSPDGNIRMDIDITKNEPDFGQTSASGAPTITTKEAKTSLLVRDGDTTVIGGVYTQNKGSSNKSVPFLSKIPILGYLFQNHSETDKRSELLIFITPRIANRRASMVDSGGL